MRAARTEGYVKDEAYWRGRSDAGKAIWAEACRATKAPEDYEFTSLEAVALAVGGPLDD